MTSPFDFSQSPLPTDKAVVAVADGEKETWALAVNPLERDRAVPGTLLFRRPQEGAFELVHHFEDLALRSLRVLPGGELALVGAAGAAILGRPGAFVKTPTPVRATLFRVDGLSREELYAAGEGSLLRFDGESWRAIPLDDAFGKGASPTLLDLHVPSPGRVWAAGATVNGACVLAGAGERFHGIELPPLQFHAVRGAPEGGALALGNDGAWRLSGGKWERTIDLSKAQVRPSGHPAFIGRYGDQILMGTVDPVGELQSLLGGRDLPETNKFNLWLAGNHHPVSLPGVRGVSYLGLLKDRLVVGATGAVFESPLPPQ